MKLLIIQKKSKTESMRSLERNKHNRNNEIII